MFTNRFDITYRVRDTWGNAFVEFEHTERHAYDAMLEVAKRQLNVKAGEYLVIEYHWYATDNDAPVYVAAGDYDIIPDAQRANLYRYAPFAVPDAPTAVYPAYLVDAIRQIRKVATADTQVQFNTPAPGDDPSILFRPVPGHSYNGRLWRTGDNWTAELFSDIADGKPATLYYRGYPLWQEKTHTVNAVTDATALMTFEKAVQYFAEAIKA